MDKLTIKEQKSAYYYLHKEQVLKASREWRFNNSNTKAGKRQDEIIKHRETIMNQSRIDELEELGRLML